MVRPEATHSLLKAAKTDSLYKIGADIFACRSVVCERIFTIRSALESFL